jgi:uncharacterized protein YcbK (DUF882 family)
MNLSRNFTLSELTKSDTAIRRGINNNPNAEQIEKLKALCENILQPVRDHFGRVKVTSGFRSVELCLAINSSEKSQHARAEAADFECIGVDNAELFVQTADGSTVAGLLINQEHRSYMRIDQKVKLNTDQY